MNYKKIHDDIIERAKDRDELEGYTEKHHIIPKCMGGTDENENLVELTAREHFIIHKLLCEIYPDNEKLQRAAYMMATIHRNKKINVSNRVYERLSKQYSKIISESQKGENNNIFVPGAIERMTKSVIEYYENNNAWNKGEELTDEHKEKLSKRRKEWWENSSEEKIKKRNKKIGESHSGMKRSKETCEKISNRKKEWHKNNPEIHNGKNNPMHKTSVLDVWVNKYGKEEAYKKWDKRYNRSIGTTKKLMED